MVGPRRCRSLTTPYVTHFASATISQSGNSDLIVRPRRLSFEFRSQTVFAAWTFGKAPESQRPPVVFE